MKTLVFVVVLLLVGIAVAGFYRGWFQLSTDTANQKPNATILMDSDRIHADEQKAKDKLQSFGQKAKEKIGDRTGNVKEPERQP